jgi:hypothetical protein
MIRRVDNGPRRAGQIDPDAKELSELESVLEASENSGSALSQESMEEIFQELAEEATVENQLLLSKEGKQFVSKINFQRAKEESVLESSSIAKNSFRRA